MRQSASDGFFSPSQSATRGLLDFFVDCRIGEFRHGLADWQVNRLAGWRIGGLVDWQILSRIDGSAHFVADGRIDGLTNFVADWQIGGFCRG